MSSTGGKVFMKVVGFRVGEGNRVRFWSDDWLSVDPLYLAFPLLFRVAASRGV